MIDDGWYDESWMMDSLIINTSQNNLIEITENSVIFFITEKSKMSTLTREQNSFSTSRFFRNP